MVPVYVINMQRSHDRWQSITFDLSHHGLVPIRIPAVDGQKIEDAHLVPMGVSLRTSLGLIGGRQLRQSHWMIDAKGAVGCTLSHIRAWKALRDNANASYAVILEDDARMEAQDLSGAIADLTRRNLHSFDLVLLTSSGKIFDPFPGQPHFIQFNKTSDTSSVHAVTKDFFGTHGYCLSKRAASVLLQYVFPIEQHVDHYIASLSRLSLLRVGATSSVLIGRGKSASTISHGHIQSHYTTVAFIVAFISLLFIWRLRASR